MLRWKWWSACIFINGAVVVSGTARADDEVVALGTPSAASRDAHRDKRLPAVLPGEVVEVSPGQRIKVWSSSGPVPVAPNVPQPPTNQQPAFGAGIGGVIVDQRPQGNPGRRYSDPVNQR